LFCFHGSIEVWPGNDRQDFFGRFLVYQLLRLADAGSVQPCDEQRFEPADFLTARNSRPIRQKSFDLSSLDSCVSWAQSNGELNGKAKD
jgi:hypothetical protein